MKNSFDFDAFIKAGENANDSKKNSQTKLCLDNQKKDKNPRITNVRENWDPNVTHVNFSANNSDNKN